MNDDRVLEVNNNIEYFVKTLIDPKACQFTPHSAINLKRIVFKIHQKGISDIFSEDRALQVNESDKQEDVEKNFYFTEAQALAHNLICIVFRIQTKDFSDILNDERAPSLKQSANSGYFGKSCISYNRAL